MRKTAFVLSTVVALATGPLARAAFGFAAVEARARALAAQPYAAPPENLPEWMQKLDYDQHRGITFAREHAWWRAERLPFQVQFFHPGWLFKSPVKINEVAGGEARPIPYSPDLFDYGALKPGRVPANLGFAGLRIHYPLVLPGDEFAVFLGASYFRAVGRGMHYGLSARGLAVDTGEPGPEEFPRFDEFWLVRPAAGDRSLTLFALLDSPSVAGAYRFELQPGDETLVTVHAVLYFRRHPAAVGLAPLTSMFLHGENTGWSRDDFRPEVHDSDGLLLHTGSGESIWRPLANPRATRVTSFSDHSPRGFGLMQRDRDLAHYEDLEANYHLRPSAWVEPLGDWGAGAVRLLEIPTPDETNDNIVACWVPAKLPAVGQPFAFDYRLHWRKEPAGRPAGVQLMASRESAVLGKPGHRRFVLDYAGLPFAGPPRDIRAIVSVGEGAKPVGPAGVQALAPLGIWRVVFELEPDGTGRPVELRCFLRENDDVLTETWSNLWTP
ncbi:MAG: glucan biosynthesis protein [Verrucomicrobiota bacterium]